MRRLPELPLFLQALGLVVATLAAAVLTSIVVAFYLPPPPPDVYSVADVMQAFRTGHSTSARDGQRLVAVNAARPLGLQSEGRFRQEFRLELAHALNADPEEVQVHQDMPRFITPRTAPVREHRPGSREQPLLFGDFSVSVLQSDGHWRVIQPEPGFGLTPWQERILLILGIAVLLVSPLAWWFARRIAAPISAFATAAERLGRDPSAPPIDIRGSAEVTAAVKAFNEMQERLGRYVESRTSTIAAIAHDLRTPLTRVRFRIEQAPEELRAKLAQDIDEMDAMIGATLSFVKDGTRPRERTRLEISSLVEAVMDEAAETGADAAVDHVDRVVVDGDPVALKRLVTNLVDNALKFGSQARGRVFTEGGMAVVEVDDNGPGVPENQIERAFEPFQRLESSRSRDTGGIGLGLAVVRAIARGHGGDVLLQNRKEGGLRARVLLPLGLAPTRA
ncbi:MAG TPA: ATP-binding protein [Caulobacteraceae bacterium]|nr:ATP-binding protein [Caulobacteraceae bacterium]